MKLSEKIRSLRQLFDRAEGGFAALALAAMVALLAGEMVARSVFGVGIPGSLPLVNHLTLWLAFLGAALAASEERLLALATPTFLPEGRWRWASKIFASTVAAAVTALLFRASLDFMLSEREFGDTVALGIPVWVTLAVMPVAFALIALRLAWKADDRPGLPGWIGRAIVTAGIVLGSWIGQRPEMMEFRSVWPGLLLLALAMLAGAPLFAVLGGAAVLLFLIDAVPIAAVPVETYRLAMSPTLPAIPLFTLTGFLLAEGKSSQRLIEVFRAFCGWVPGGTAVVAAVVCAFFTIFTGGSGVTILALGGLLFKALQADGYRERFSLGLLTASGSLGLLLPPALPLILYGIVAQVPIQDLFLGGLLPGLLLVALIAGWGLREGIKTGVGRTAFRWSAARRSLWDAKWELLLPVFLLVAIFGGLTTVVEASALGAFYALVIQCFIHRDLSLTRDVPRVLRQCVVLIGGVLIILSVAMGLTSYLVDAQIPSQLLDWVQSQVSSKLVFLLMLNVFLLLVGCLMDIFSATVVVVPLIVPLGAAFGIDPIHLGIIFIANLELGYLTPPVGLNLFLASYRFERPLLSIYRAAVPMLIILGIGVLLITYVPFLTTGIFGLLGR
ncbi:MAG: TRAP transporter large permease subunit [Thermoanaerobaculia bacterium]